MTVSCLPYLYWNMSLSKHDKEFKYINKSDILCESWYNN
jgi:hypothetical protein